jgi:K+-transporting ATPase KdpF subunit
MSGWEAPVAASSADSGGGAPSRTRSKDSVKIRQGRVRALVSGRTAANDERVIEDLLAALIGLALIVYLAYALARPERF